MTYEDPDSKEWMKVFVISRACKASGGNNYWFNIKDLDDNTMKSLAFEDISSWKNLGEGILICDRESLEVTEAKLDELESWKKKKVFTEVYNEGQEIISVWWVLSEKTQEGVLIVKARLVAQDFQDMERNFVRKDPPICSRENFRLILAAISLQS